MVLAGRAAEPVLVASVLYASVKLLPSVHFPPQLDVAVFIAQFVALDIGGLSLNKLAEQAKKDGNAEGAKYAKRLSVALVAVMLAGVIMAGVDQIVQLNGQVGTVIATILVITRAVMAVLYSRVIHGLRQDGEPLLLTQDRLKELIIGAVNVTLLAAVTNLRSEVTKQLTVTLSQHLDERLSELDTKQAETLKQLRDEQIALINETVAKVVEAVGRQATAPLSPKVRSITEAASRKQAASTAPQKIDHVVWPLLSTGMSVREIAVKANTSPATVGRSRKRWEAAQSGSITNLEASEQVETAECVI